MNNQLIKIISITVLCTVLGVTSAVLIFQRLQEKSVVSEPIKLVEPQKGDMSMRGGTATIREAYVADEDDPTTTNDESNDQPRGHYGTKTVYARNLSSGNSYPLDADLNGSEVERLYFPKGGWVDFPDCEMGDTCIDEKGNRWEIEED